MNAHPAVKKATEQMTVEQANDFKDMVFKYIVSFGMSTVEAVEYAQYISSKREAR